MTKHALRLVVVAAIVLISAAQIPAHGLGSCLETRLAEPFVAPDGSVHQAGVVRICPYWSLTPSVRLSKITLNGSTLGVWMSRAGEGGAFSGDDSRIALRRLPQGGVALADYYWPGADGRPVAPGLRQPPTELAVETNTKLGFSLQ